MAKIQTKTILIKFNKIVKDSDKSSFTVINSEILKTLEDVAQEMCGSDIIVEVETVNE